VVGVIVVCYAEIVNFHLMVVRAVRVAVMNHMIMNGKVNGKNTNLGQVLLLPSGHPSQPSGRVVSSITAGIKSLETLGDGSTYSTSGDPPSDCTDELSGGELLERPTVSPTPRPIATTDVVITAVLITFGCTIVNY